MTETSLSKLASATLLVATVGSLSLPAVADSLATSAAAGGSSASSASSASSDKSSDSSSRTQQAAAGPYRIVDLAQLAERPGTLRMTMRAQSPVGDEARPDLVLYVPQDGIERSGLDVGQIVMARARPYGTEFAAADTRRAFFLLINDAWSRELVANPVTL